MIFIDRCEVCDEPGASVCLTCIASLQTLPVPPPVIARGRRVDAAFEYSGSVRRLILVLKTRRALAVADVLARLAVTRLDLVSFAGIVTWAPTGAARLSERGHDQSRLLSGAIARHTSARSLATLRRRDDRIQTGAPRSERLHGQRFISRPMRFDLPIVLVDDVVTTGSTLHHARTCLTSAGAPNVRCVAIAATPEPKFVR